MANIYLVRHGETELSREGRFCGHTDEALNSIGMRQAELLGSRLAPQRVETIYSSDLVRSQRTAQVVAAALRAAVVPCPELREIHFGHFEGLTFSEIEQRYPEAARLWVAHSPHMAAPGGESLGHLAARVSGFSQLLQKHKDGETAVAVGHSGSLRVLLCILLGIGLEHWWQMSLDCGSISVVETHPEGAILRLLNDTSHLIPRA